MERLLARFRPSAPGPRDAALRLDASDATVAPDLNETLSAEHLANALPEAIILFDALGRTIFVN